MGFGVDLLVGLLVYFGWLVGFVCLVGLLLLFCGVFFGFDVFFLLSSGQLKC